MATLNNTTTLSGIAADTVEDRLTHFFIDSEQGLSDA